MVAAKILILEQVLMIRQIDLLLGFKVLEKVVEPQVSYHSLLMMEVP